MTSSLSVCQAMAHLPPLHKQQLFVEHRGSTVRVHLLASRSCRARQQHQPRCGAPAAAASQPCSKHGSQRPSWRQGFLTPAATTRQEAEQQQEEGLAPLTPSKDANGNFTSAALASLRYTSPDGSWLVRPLNKDDAAEVGRQRLGVWAAQVGEACVDSWSRLQQRQHLRRRWKARAPARRMCKQQSTKQLGSAAVASPFHDSSAAALPACLAFLGAAHRGAADGGVPHASRAACARRHGQEVF